MARRGRRRSGEGTYHPSRRSLPRPLILDLLDAVYSPTFRPKRPQSHYNRGYGGGFTPPCKARVAAPTAAWRHLSIRHSPGPPRCRSSGVLAARHPPPRTPLLKAGLLLRQHIVSPSILTMPGDRKTEAVKRPRRVTQCTQRQDRKEVLHALGVAGRRGSAPGRRGKYRRTLMSNFSCKG